MSIETRRYAPILKWKAGEKVALEKLTPDQKRLISPVLEIVDYEEPFKIIEQIKLCFFKEPAYLDTRYSDDDDREFLESILTLAREENYPLYPVLYYEDFSLFADKFQVLSDRILIRIPIPEDIDGESYETVFETISEWQKNNETIIDIMLDLNFMSGRDQTNTKFAELKSVLRNFIINGRFIGKIMIASTSFPEDLSTLSAGEDLFIDRFEYKLFERIYNNPDFDSLKTRLVLSDYGVTRFTDTEIDFSKLKYGILPKARYTLNEKYWVLKGKKDQKTKQTVRGHQKIAYDIYKSDQYFGIFFSYGDMEIKERALGEKGPGNNTNWVTIAANHHIVVVTSELSKLFEL